MHHVSRHPRQSWPAGSQGGFTLLEILVAVAVLAIALAAIIKAVSQYSADVTYLRDKTLAQWVAQNQLAALRIQQQWPEPGESRGVAEMAKREWHWTRQVKDTADEDVRRVEIGVRRDDTGEQALITLVGFLERPL